MTSSLLTSRRGFSILMALWSTGVLLIIVVGMANVFLSEMRLSRLQYDSILSATQAEWAFEYAMLKIKNHRDGFADTMNKSSPDALIFSGASPRTDKVEIQYTIETQSTNIVFSGWNDNYTIFPLFVGKCQWYIDALGSCDPSAYTGITQVRNITELSTSWNPSDLSWSIVAMSGGENISIAWLWAIDGSEVATMRLQWESCYDNWGIEKPITINLNSDGSCPNPYNQASWGDTIPYLYDLTWSTLQFLNSSGKFTTTTIRDPYILIFSSWGSANITLKTDTPFTLPELKVTTEARKGNALQSIRFTEDKSKYYDALKYGVYNTNP